MSRSREWHSSTPGVLWRPNNSMQRTALRAAADAEHARSRSISLPRHGETSRRRRGLRSSRRGISSGRRVTSRPRIARAPSSALPRAGIARPRPPSPGFPCHPRYSRNASHRSPCRSSRSRMTMNISGMTSSRPWKKAAARAWSGRSKSPAVVIPNARAAGGRAEACSASESGIPLANRLTRPRAGRESAPISFIASRYQTK